jgi:hypothetical protein
MPAPIKPVLLFPRAKQSTFVGGLAESCPTNVSMTWISDTEKFARAASGTLSKQKHTGALSSIHPYHRGYRLAPRDVRHTTTLNKETIDELGVRQFGNPT